MEDVTRRNFVLGLGSALGMLGLAACGASTASEEPAASEQPAETAEAAPEEAAMSEAQGISSPIVTELAPLERFFPAEAEHQQYFQRHGRQPYCVAVVAPKVAKFRQRFAGRLRD